MSEALEYRESDKSVLVPWSLPDLPTAQHKAGLAGLFVYVSKMSEFIQNAPIPVIESRVPAGIEYPLHPGIANDADG